VLVTVTVAANKSDSRAEGGRMILSPLRGGVESKASTSNWVDHFSGGRSWSVLMVDGGEESQGLASNTVAS